MDGGAESTARRRRHWHGPPGAVACAPHGLRPALDGPLPRPAGARLSSRVADRGHRRLGIDDTRHLDRDAFVAQFGGVFEATPWIAAAAWDAGPYASVAALHA